MLHRVNIAVFSCLFVRYNLIERVRPKCLHHRSSIVLLIVLVSAGLVVVADALLVWTKMLSSLFGIGIVHRSEPFALGTLSLDDTSRLCFRAFFTAYNRHRTKKLRD